MFSLELNALVMLNIVLKLVVIDHCMAKESEFMTCLRLFEVHQFVSKVVFNCLVNHRNFFLMMTRHCLMSVNVMIIVVFIVMFIFMMFVMMVVIGIRIRISVSVMMIRCSLLVL